MPSLDAPSRTPDEIAAITAAAIEAADDRIAGALRIEAPTFDELFGALDDAARGVSTAYGQTEFFGSVAADDRIAGALRIEAPTFDELFGALDDAARGVSTAYGQTGFFGQVAEDDAAREAAGQAFEAIEKWRSAVAMRPEVAVAITRFAETVDRSSLDAESAAYLRRWETDVRLSGAALPEAERAEVTQLTNRLAELATTFINALATVDRLELTAAELEGLPDALVSTYKPGST